MSQKWNCAAGDLQIFLSEIIGLRDEVFIKENIPISRSLLSLTHSAMDGALFQEQGIRLVLRLALCSLSVQQLRWYCSVPSWEGPALEQHAWRALQLMHNSSPPPSSAIHYHPKFSTDRATPFLSSQYLQFFQLFFFTSFHPTWLQKQVWASANPRPGDIEIGGRKTELETKFVAFNSLNPKLLSNSSPNITAVCLLCTFFRRA